MKISIITPCWNSEATIRQTMESILSQTYADFEHIIVDGFSSDNTIKIVHEFEPRYNGKLRVLCERDKGIYDAMNKGIALAKGDVVGVLNSDDFYAGPDVLDAIAKNIDGVEAVYGNLHFVCKDNPSIIKRYWKGSQYSEGAFLKGWHPAHPTFYARRECYEKFGGFDISLNISADFELMLRFIEKHHISTKYIPITFVKMRYGGESTKSLGSIVRGNRNILQAFRKNGFNPPAFYIVRRLIPKAFNLVKCKFQ